MNLQSNYNCQRSVAESQAHPPLKSSGLEQQSRAAHLSERIINLPPPLLVQSQPRESDFALSRYCFLGPANAP